MTRRQDKVHVHIRRPERRVFQDASTVGCPYARIAEWLGANGRIAKKADMAGKQADRFVKMARGAKWQGYRMLR